MTFPSEMTHFKCLQPSIFIHFRYAPLKRFEVFRTRLQPIRKFIPHRSRLNIPFRAMSNWSSLAIALLEEAHKQDGVWHLWGHSWEIDKFNMWSQLETILSVASKYQAQTKTNTQLVIS